MSPLQSLILNICVQVVMDAFALPVEGTETRVNAQSQAYEYMTAYIESAKEVGKFILFHLFH